MKSNPGDLASRTGLHTAWHGALRSQLAAGKVIIYGSS